MINNNNTENLYSKEIRIRDKLFEEIYQITQNNLQMTIKSFCSIIEKCMNVYYSEEKAKILRLYADKDNNFVQEKLIEEKKNTIEFSNYLCSNIKDELETLFNNDLKNLEIKINDLFSSNVNIHNRIIYNSIKNDKYNYSKIKEKLNDSIKKYEESYRVYLLKKMKYKEELAIYNSRQKLKEENGIDIQSKYNNIFNFLKNNNSNNIHENNNIICNTNDNLNKLENTTNMMKECFDKLYE